MKTMKYYQDLYLCDVLLLADVFKKFENNSLKNDRLCPSHYFSPPGLTWDVMLKNTKTEIELITDPDMLIFFEKGTKGEIFYITNRYSEASKRYLKSYYPKQ